jgi:hypothetical protein
MTHMMIEESLQNEIESFRMDACRAIERNPAFGEKIDTMLLRIIAYLGLEDDPAGIIQVIAMLTLGLERIDARKKEEVTT